MNHSNLAIVLRPLYKIHGGLYIASALISED